MARVGVGRTRRARTPGFGDWMLDWTSRPMCSRKVRHCWRQGTTRIFFQAIQFLRCYVKPEEVCVVSHRIEGYEHTRKLSVSIRVYP